MRSKASLRGHPIHPMLIPFPLAFLTGGFVFDILGSLLERPALWSTAYYLTIAGVGMALLAAVPGLVDYFYTVPPNSSGKARATKHMLANLTVVALFTVAWLLREGANAPPATIVLGLEGVGTVLLGIGGWMGGVLVTRNLVSVDHRYAEAGKWKDESFEANPGKPVVVGKSDELEINQMKLVRIGGKRLVIGRTEQGYVAFDDHCTHRGGSLAGGVMICGTVQCLWHGSQFSVKTGKVEMGPATKAISTYKVQEREGELRLTLE